MPLFSPTRRRGRGMSRETSLLSPSLIPRPRWARTPGCSGSYLDFIESLIQVFQQISLVRLKHRRSDLLLHMPCHLSKIQGLRWQGGSLERGCLAHSEISWLSSLAQGASPHSHFHLNVSITSMLKPMNTRKIAFSTPSQPPHGDL